MLCTPPTLWYTHWQVRNGVRSTAFPVTDDSQAVSHSSPSLVAIFAVASAVSDDKSATCICPITRTLV